MKYFQRIPLIALALLLPFSWAQGFTIKRPPEPHSQSSISLKANGSHGYVLQDQNSDFYILTTLSSPHSQTAKNLPLNLSIVIDRSGSMAEKGKLVYAKEAARNFVQKLSPEDRVSIVEYDEQITVLAEPSLVGSDRAALLRKIDLLEPRGSTNLAGGMVEGAKQVERFVEANRINRVLLLSDGLANTGVSTIAGVSELAEGLIKKGIQVTTLGMGADFDEDMLSRIADVSGGNYYFIESPIQTAGIFEKERHALSTVVARDVELTLDLSDQVELVDLYGYPYKQRGSKITVNLPDLYSGRDRKILIKLKPNIKEASELKVADVRLDYKDVASDLKLATLNSTVTAKVTKDRRLFEQSANNDILVESVKIASARSVEDAMKRYATGDVSGADSLLDKAKNLLQGAYNATQSPALMNEIHDINSVQGGMKSVAPESEEGKIFIKSKKSDAREQQQ